MRKCIKEVIQQWAQKGIKSGDFDMDELEDALVELWKQTVEQLKLSKEV